MSLLSDSAIGALDCLQRVHGLHELLIISLEQFHDLPEDSVRRMTLLVNAYLLTVALPLEELQAHLNVIREEIRSRG